MFRRPPRIARTPILPRLTWADTRPAFTPPADVDQLDNLPPLTADHLHVILDCLDAIRGYNIPEHFAMSYDDPADDDPKGTAAGWERVRAEAEKAIGERLARA